MVGASSVSRYGRIERSKLRRVYINSDVEYFGVPRFSVPLFSFIYRTVAGYFLIRKLIEKGNIDVIVLYSVTFTGMPTIYAAKAKGVPVAFRSIDMLHKLNDPGLRQNMIKWFEKFAYQRVDLVLALSPNYDNYVSTLAGRKIKTVILLFPVDLSMFCPGQADHQLKERYGIRSSDTVLLYMGYFYEFSDLLTFTELLVNEMLEDPDLKLLLLGDGPLKSELEQIAEKYNLANRLIVTGIRPFEEMPRHINSASICLNLYPKSGLMADLFCAKVVQYLACGKPVFSTSVPGLKSVIVGEAEGVRYFDRLEPMMEAIRTFKTQKDEYQELGKLGIEYTRHFHSINVIAVNLETHLQGLLTLVANND